MPVKHLVTVGHVKITFLVDVETPLSSMCMTVGFFEEFLCECKGPAFDVFV